MNKIITDLIRRIFDRVNVDFFIFIHRHFQSANCQLKRDLLFTATLLPRVSQLSKPPGLDDNMHY